MISPHPDRHTWHCTSVSRIVFSRGSFECLRGAEWLKSAKMGLFLHNFSEFPKLSTPPHATVLSSNIKSTGHRFYIGQDATFTTVAIPALATVPFNFQTQAYSIAKYGKTLTDCLCTRWYTDDRWKWDKTRSKKIRQSYLVT